MICYHESLTQPEILAVNDYWLLSTETYSGFQYSVQEVTSLHRGQQIRGVSALAGRCSFVSSDPSFSCPSCQRKKPVRGRQEYSRRIKAQKSESCSECIAKQKRQLFDSAQEILDAFKAENFVPGAYLELLSVEESLALLSLVSGLADGNFFLGECLETLSITGCQALDQKFLISFLSNGVITLVSEIPLEVERANRIIFGQYDRITYDYQPKNAGEYRNPGTVTPGLYLNAPVVDGEVYTSGIASLVYQNLQASGVSPADATKVHHIIREIQLDKMYRMTREISAEYGLPIDNSNTLRSLLLHLATNYAPQQVYFTFNVKAKDTIVYMHKERPPFYIENQLFAKFVGNYIQMIENRGWELKKTWGLPPSIQTSPFEALFCQLYLDSHFDWNPLSAKQVVAVWLENVELTADAQELLT